MSAVYSLKKAMQAFRLERTGTKTYGQDGDQHEAPQLFSHVFFTGTIYGK